MTAFDLKIIAILTMVIDHVGLVFFPQVILWRIIGRLSFPLFAFLVANGAHFTKNLRGYLIRLFLFALLSQVPFVLVNRLIDPSFYGLNIFFTLFLGLLSIKFYKKDPPLGFFAVTLLAGLAETAGVDYGAMGVLSIFLFYVFFGNLKAMIISQVLLFVAQPLFYIAIRRIPAVPLSFIELYALFSLIFIAFYNYKEGIRMKYLFYVFYPLQYLVLYALKLILK